MRALDRIVYSHSLAAYDAPPESGNAPQIALSGAMIETLLDATTRVFRRYGYDRASTHRITEIAGVGVGSLYRYFPNEP